MNWTHVSEALPNWHVPVLLTDGKQILVGSAYRDDNAKNKCEWKACGVSGYEWDWDFDIDPNQVTHWMPLPPLPSNAQAGSRMKIALCLPFYSTDCKSYFALSLMKTRWPDNAEIQVFQTLGTWTPNAMVQFVDASLQSGADFMVMASVDVGWSPDTIKRMIGHNKQVIGAWSSGRMSPFPCHVADEYDAERKLFRPVKDARARSGLERVCAVGGELTVYRMDVFKIIPRPWFFGPDSVLTDRLMTEDYHFAAQAHKHGVEIWCDWECNVIHNADGLVTDEGELHAIKL